MFFTAKSESLPSLFAQSLFFKERRVWFLLVALDKRAAGSLPSFFTKEGPWAISPRCSWQKSEGSDSLFFTSKSLFCSQKTSDLLEKPMSKFPTLCNIIPWCRSFSYHYPSATYIWHKSSTTDTSYSTYYCLLHQQTVPNWSTTVSTQISPHRPCKM